MNVSTRMMMGAGAAMLLAGAAMALPTPDYLKAAGASDLFEKQSAQVVLASTSNPKVKSFATMMVTDHSKSTAMVKAAATKSGMAPKPPMLMPKQQAMLAELKAAKGLARDTLYVTQQKMAHEEALATQKDYAATGDKPALRKVAGEIVPVVEHHIHTLSMM